jgi:adenosylhomocysteine nucleosidase
MPRPIGLVVAFPQEIKHFLKHLDIDDIVKENGIKIYETHFSKHNLVIAICGLGKQNARKAANQLMKTYYPQGLISTGFSGALVPGIKPGVVIVPERILDISNDKVIKNYPIEQDWWTNQLWDAMNFSGILLCTDTVISESQKKLDLGKEYHAVMVDMESAGVAAVAEENRIPFCAVRVITDPANESLPMDFNQFIDDKNNLMINKILLSLLTRPSQIKFFLQLMKTSRFAAKHLSGFLYLLFGKR